VLVVSHVIFANDGMFTPCAVDVGGTENSKARLILVRWARQARRLERAGARLRHAPGPC
jgi:hypothetical protein